MKIARLFYLISFFSVAMYGMEMEPINVQNHSEKELGFPEIYAIFALSKAEINGNENEEDHNADDRPLRRSKREIKPGPLHVCRLCDCQKVKGH
jgi:hypothetical protein